MLEPIDHIHRQHICLCVYVCVSKRVYKSVFMETYCIYTLGYIDIFREIREDICMCVPDGVLENMNIKIYGHIYIYIQNKHIHI